MRKATGVVVVVVAALLIWPGSGLLEAQQQPEQPALAHEATVGATNVPWTRSGAQLDQPWSVAGDGDGVWIADAAGRRLQWLGAGPPREIGRAGLTHAIYERPVRWIADVAVWRGAWPTGPATPVPSTPQPSSAVRTVWLADRDAHVVVALLYESDTSVRHLLSLGVHDEPGADAAHLDGPTGVALDERGNVYVSDTGNHRVQVFAPDGSHLATIGRTGLPGPSDDSLASPGRLSVGRDGHLYVPDTGNHRVQVFDIADPAAPRYATTFGSAGRPGAQPGRFSAPLGVATDATFLYVADSGNCRVQVIHRSTKQLQASIGSAQGCTGEDEMRRPSDVTLDASSQIYVADPGRMLVHWFGAEDRQKRGQHGTDGVPYVSDDAHHNEPAGVALGSDGALYFVEQAGHRFLRRSADGTGSWSIGQAGVPGDDDAHLDQPSDVAVDSGGRSYVADRGNARVQVYAADGSLERTFGRRGTGDGELVCPTGLAVASSGDVLVADPCRGDVQVFDASGVFRESVGGPTGSAPPFEEPSDVAVSSGGGWIVADGAAHVVYVLDAGHRLTRAIGAPGSPGDAFDRLHDPAGVSVDARDRLYVADRGNHRVQVFGAAGEYLTTIGGLAGSCPGCLREPSGVAVSAAGRLAVADTANHRIEIFEPVTGAWAQSNTNGFGDRDNVAVTALVAFDGALYAGTENAADGGAVWQLQSSGQWLRVSEPGFGDRRNVRVSALAALEGGLYAGTTNRIERVDPTTGQVTYASAGAQLWLSRDGRQWEPVSEGGFGDARRAEVTSVAMVNGRLMVGTGSVDGSVPAQVLRPAAFGSGWQIALEAVNARRIGAMHADGDANLYVGTCEGFGRPELWRTSDGYAWFPHGDPDLSYRGADLGSGDTDCVTSLLSHDGALYAALGSDRGPNLRSEREPGPIEVLRRKDDQWQHVAAFGMGSALNRGRVGLHAFTEPPFRYVYLAVGNPYDGLEVWRAADGDAWEQVRVGGFGDALNQDLGGGQSMAAFSGRLYVGTYNGGHGGEIWSSAGSRPLLATPTPTGASGVPSPTPTSRPRPDPPQGRVAYQMVDQWPTGRTVAGDVFGDIADMAVAADGTVYLLDTGLDRVLRLLPDGTWATPIGDGGAAAGQIGKPWAIAVDASRGVLYVGDRATDRLLAFNLDGQLRSAMLGVHPISVAVQPDGTLWVADLMSGSLRHLTPDWTELERFGSFGPDEDTQFWGLQAIAVDPAGTLFVGDANGLRLRGFRRRGGTYERFRTLDLSTPPFAGCSSARLGAVGVDTVLAGGCLIDGEVLVERLPTDRPGLDLYGLRLHSVSEPAGLYYALGRLDTDPTSPANRADPVVVRFRDRRFHVVEATWGGRDLVESGAGGDLLTAATRLSTAPDGTLMLTDAVGLRRFTIDGRELLRYPTTSYPSSHYAMRLEPGLAVGEGGANRLVGIAHVQYGNPRRPYAFEALVYADAVSRRYCRAGVCETGVYLDVLWDSIVSARSALRIAIALEPTAGVFALLELYADNPSPIEDHAARLLLYDLAFGGRKTEIVLPGGEREALWTDVDAGPDGRIYVLDSLNDVVLVFDPRGRQVASIAAPKDAWRVAGGPNAEVFFLTGYGHCARLAADGTELSRFVALPSAAVPPAELVDLTVDQSGWVYVVDGQLNRVSVFAPQGREADVLQGDRCYLAGDKWVAPGDILLGDTAGVTMSLFGTCGFVEEPADIVLAVNTWGGSMNAAAYNDSLRSARQILAVIDMDRHRVGTIAFAATANADAPITGDTQALISSLRNMGAGPPLLCQGQSIDANMYEALLVAEEMFRGSSAGRKVLLVVHPGNNCGAFETGMAEVTARLRAMGVVVIGVNGATSAATGELYNNISVPPRGMGTGRAALRRMHARTQPPHLLASGTLVDRLPDNIDYVEGSAQPAAVWDAAQRTLTWRTDDLALYGTHLFSIDIRPREEGWWPTNVEAVVDAIDGWGQPARFALPVPRVRVYGPLPPSATPTPSVTTTAPPTPTPTVTPTAPATPVPKPLYLPIGLRVPACKPESRHADVALVIDTSISMSETTRPDGPTKLAAARDAAGRFIDLLVPRRDQVALIQFNAQVAVVVPLTDDMDAARRGLDRLTQAGGTHIDLALDAARSELLGPSRRPANNQVLVLLTDGEPTGTTPDAVRAAAARARASGLLVYCIGLGADVDHALLGDVAGLPDRYFPAPDTSDLADIYAQIAYAIPCRPAWP